MLEYLVKNVSILHVLTCYVLYEYVEEADIAVGKNDNEINLRNQSVFTFHRKCSQIILNMHFEMVVLL